MADLVKISKIKTSAGEHEIDANYWGGKTIDVLNDLNNMEEITYSDLNILKTGSKLIKGKQYRITDYVTTTTQENTQSAGHSFDIIVTADSNNTFNEVARACLHSGDTYFSGVNMDAWEIKYSFDNDTNRFAWASSSGKGVIYYMKDEWNNECWYDFKNIQFNCVVKQTHNSQEVEFRPDGYEYAYTFTDYDGNDLSLTQNARNNSIKKYTTSGNGLQSLNNISFICSAVHNNNIEENSYSNVFYVSSCYYNSIGRGFQNNFISAPTGTDRSSIHNNIIGNLFKSNRIQSSFNRNVIGNTTTSCDFLSSFYFNELGNNSYNIDFNYPISYCKFGSYIQYCIFNNTATYQPSVSEMKWCTIGDGLEGAQYIPCCEKVTFEDRVLYNTSENFHINDVILNDGTKLVEQLVQQHEDRLYVCSVDGGCAVFRYKNTVSEINLGTFDSIESVSSKASEIDICSNQNITRMSFKIDNDSRKYANGFIEQFISGGPYSINGVEYYYIVQTLYFNGLTQSRQIVYTINDSVKNIRNIGGWLTIIDHDNSNTESPILYSRSSEVVNIASSQTITGSKRFDSDINLAGKTFIRNGSDIDAGELKVFKATDSGAGFTIRTNGKFSNNVPILELLATNNSEAYKYQFPQLPNTKDPDFVVVRSQLNELNNYVYIEWGELVSLKDNGELKPGRKYRITDYVTTTTQENTQSAGHQFDIIVEALNENTLSENAKAIQNENDGYFDESNLEAWELKYCLDNDNDRFTWADTTNGKGVIYYMKDEFNNECPYDFKNIQFVRYKLNPPTVGGYENEWQNKLSEDVNVMFKNNHLSYIWHGSNSENYYWENYFKEVFSTATEETKAFYTFSDVINDEITDKSLTNVCYSNVIKENYVSEVLKLNNNIFFSKSNYNYCHSNSFGESCYSNSFGETCYSNSFGIGCTSNIFGEFCNNNIFGNSCTSNIFGKSCHANIFGNSCHANILDHNCYFNILGNSCNINSFDFNCYSNSFGDSCYYNALGESCHSNIFGNSCGSNIFGNSCISNTFTDSCESNIFGNSCESNSFGIGCQSNSFGNSCGHNAFGNACCYNSFGNNCESNSFGEYCCNNSFGEYCYSIRFGEACASNVFGNSCNSNVFGNNCDSNSFGNNCKYNIFGNSCNFNSFGNSCESNRFGNSCSYNGFYVGSSYTINNQVNGGYSVNSEKLNYVRNITISEGCAHLLIYTTITTNSTNYVQNITITKGIKYTTFDGRIYPLEILIPDVNNEYEIKVAKNTSGELKIYCEADLIA